MEDLGAGARGQSLEPGYRLSEALAQMGKLLRHQAASCGPAVYLSCFVNLNLPSKPLPSFLTQRPFAMGFDFCRIKAKDTNIHHHPPSSLIRP